MSEKRIEIELRNRMRNAGGAYYKFVSQAQNGIPDRICIFPSGRLIFVELKKPDGRLSKIQKVQIQKLKDLKQEVCVIWSMEDVDRFMRRYRDGI